MRYTLLMHYPEMTETELGPEGVAYGQQQMNAYATTLDQAGVLLSAEVLRDSAISTTLTRKSGTLQIQDGPFADTKDQLGGTFVIDVEDLDAAIGWAQSAPAAEWGSVEIRPGAVYFADGAWRGND